MKYSRPLFITYNDTYASFYTVSAHYKTLTLKSFEYHAKCEQCLKQYVQPCAPPKEIEKYEPCLC